MESCDIHEKVRRRNVGSTIVFVVDSSGSMAARKRMIAAKETILALLVDAYQKRDKVALVAFRGDRAEVLVPPTSSVELAKRNLEELPTGGKTPLSQGLLVGQQLLKTELIRDPRTQPLMVVISDGRANVGAGHESDAADEACRVAEQIHADAIPSLVIDTEPAEIRLGHMRRIAESLDASYQHIEGLQSEQLVTAVRDAAQMRQLQEPPE